MGQEGISGWFARLDRCCPERPMQLEKWLEKWEESLQHQLPIAALLPPEWPTLPANLLAGPGQVSDFLLARYDAQNDGRSPRGAHPTPALLADAMISAELAPCLQKKRVATPTKPKVDLSALPPAYREHMLKMQAAEAENESEEEEKESEPPWMQDVRDGARTRSGIPLPFCDPAVGAGLFPSRLLKRHAVLLDGWDPDEMEQDTRRLLKGMQLLDVSPLAIKVARIRLVLAMIKFGLVSLNDDKWKPGQLKRTEAEELVEKATLVGDSLIDEWLWDEKPRLLLCNPPWLRIKDRFRGHPDGSRLRKELGEELRGIRNKDGTKRFSAMRGNVNLYRLFLERSLQLVANGGRIRLVVPDSLLREKSSTPLRQLLVNNHAWTDAWSFEESAHLFPGITQGVLVIGLTIGGLSEMMEVRGPVARADLQKFGCGISDKVPTLDLDRERWSSWTKGEWAIPRLPRDKEERKRLLKTVDELADHPRLSEPTCWLSEGPGRIRVRVGEADQTSWASQIRPWTTGGSGTPFIRGVHFSSDESGEIILNHPAFNKDIPPGATEMQQARWSGSLEPSESPRIACQAIVNAQQKRRLRWVVAPPKCILGNSVNYLELPHELAQRLGQDHGDYITGLHWLCKHLNSSKLDEWARAWAANNNVNNYELENLPMPEPVSRN